MVFSSSLHFSLLFLTAPHKEVQCQTSLEFSHFHTGAEAPLKLKAEVYASSFYALDVVRETMSRLYAEGTRDAFLQGNPVERALRNIHAIVFGLQSVRPCYDAAGRVFLGGEPQLPVF